jgi:two-component system chemotaxis response regulator CheB
MTRGADVVVVDDSAICRQRLRSIIEGDGDLRVSGEVRAGAEVLPTLDRLRPAVLVTDLVMPDMNGIEVVREVMARHPLPIIVVSGAGIAESTAFEATRSGALEVATKPALGDLRAAAALREAIRRVRDVPVVRHPGRWSVPARAAASAPLLEAEGAAPRVLGLGASAGGPRRRRSGGPARSGASATGGGGATLAGSGDGVRAFLGGTMPSRGGDLSGDDAAASGATGAAGRRHASGRAGARHRRCRPSRRRHPLGAQRGRPLHQPRPQLRRGRRRRRSCRGIGSDGAQGLAALRAKGALTFAQDEASSAVYGMPRAAAEAARFRLAPPDIARVVAARCGQRDSDGAPR